jgi:hypothetical protein
MSEVNNSYGLFGFLKGLLAFGGMTVVCESAFAFVRFDEMGVKGTLLTVQCIVWFSVGLILLIRNSLVGKSTWGAFVIFSNIVSAVGYFTTRSMMTVSMQEYLMDWLPIGDSFAFFNSLLLLGYSTFQFIIGYFVAKFGTRFIGIFGICNAIILFILNFCDSETSLLFIEIIRFMIGVFCSSTIISISYHINKFKCIPDKFGVISNIAIVVAAVGSVVILNHFPVINDVSFSLLNNILMGLFAIPGIVFVIDSFVSKHEIGTFHISDYAEYFSDLFGNRKYMILFVQAILVMIGFSVIRERFLPDISSEGFSGLKICVEKGMTYGVMFMISFMNFMGYYRTIFFNAVCNVIGIGILFLHVFVIDVSYDILAFSVFSIAFSQIGHTVVQSIVGEFEARNPAKAASMIAILNTATMLVGGAIIGQNFIPSLGYAGGIGVMFIICLLSLLIAFYSLLSFDERK